MIFILSFNKYNQMNLSVSYSRWYNMHSNTHIRIA